MCVYSDKQQDNIIMAENEGGPIVGGYRQDSSENDTSHYTSDVDNEDALLKRLRPVRSDGSSEGEASFATPSPQNCSFGTDQPPSPPCESINKTVHFRDELEEVHEVERVNEEDEGNYWLTQSDFHRIETELNITNFRWENHVRGRIAFDEANNCTRGLESMDSEKQRRKDLAQYKHYRSVLGEVERQKSNHGEVTNWDKVRDASEQHTAESRQHATEMGKRDEEENRHAWGESSQLITEASTKKLTKKKIFVFCCKKQRGEGVHLHAGAEASDVAVPYPSLKKAVKKRLDFFRHKK